MANTLKTYAIRSAAGVRIVRVPESDAHLQAGPGETIAAATAQDHADLAAARQAAFSNLASLRAEPTETAIVLEALKSKLTPAELAVARQKLRAGRT